MGQRLLFLIKYYLFWVFTFWLFKGIFLIYHSNLYAGFSFVEIAKIFIYGTRLDFSFSAYITLFPLFVLIISCFLKSNFPKKIISYYTYILLALISLICISDLEIFKWWGFRIDSSIFKYNKTLKEVAVSIEVSPVYLLSSFAIILTILLSFIYYFLIYRKNDSFQKTNLIQAFKNAFVLLLTIPLLILSIRGGLQLAPINQSSVAFSNNQFLNMAAVNAPWNFCFSIIEKNYSETNPFIYQSEKEVKKRIDSLYQNTSNNISVVKKGKLNLCIIIWESFTAKSVESMGGAKGITPKFDKLIHEGILFDNIYASGDRSDKGLIAILSGFPAQPITSIMQKPTKTANLPSLSNTFNQQNYNTSFYYGGETEFANIKSYLISSKYGRIIAKNDFPKESWNSKWGAHDEVVLDRLSKDLNKEKQPFFSSIFTLSSHEPFEIPMTPLLPGKDEGSLFLNSIHYTDSCIYNFIENAKKANWWDNTLIVIVADHGHRLPESPIPVHLPSEFKVPVLWLGGALTKKDTIITQIGSQTDLAKTILNQFNTPSTNYTFSKDLLNGQSKNFAYYSFNNGFGFLTPKGNMVFDNVSKTFILKDSTVDGEQIKNGKAYLQYSFQEYLNK